jgi:hypothetical protein
VRTQPLKGATAKSELMDKLVDLIAVTLATGAIIEVWHKGSIFATARAYSQAIQDIAKHGSFRALWPELLNCPFCKSYHVPFYLFLALCLADYFGGIASVVVRAIVFGLAATRASNLIDGLLPTRMQYEPTDTSGTDGLGY